jgi:hypothetical protein
MIIKTFDYGWGPELETKKLEAEILRTYLRPFAEDSSSTVIINNTWYSDWAHAQTVESLKENRPDRIVLVAMIDAANCHADRFQEFADDIRSVGYYAGPDEIDFWALAVKRWIRIPDGDLLDHGTVDTAFMCLNRKPHWHRQRLYDAIVAAGIVDQGLVSMGARIDGELAQRSLPQDTGVSDLNLNPNPGVEQTGIVNDIMSLGHPDNWRRIFLDVITETQFNLRRTRFVSEKIYKPIMGMRPFLVHARDGAVPWLTQRGFEPYVADFQDITDLDLGLPGNTLPFLCVLCAQPRSYWQSKLVALREKIFYNRNRFDLYVEEVHTKINQGIQCQI